MKRAGAGRGRPGGLRAAATLAFLAVAPVGCGGGGDATTVIRFWGMGREGEVVAELAAEFERENPGLRVDVQQIPWSAAHEKLLTAHVGGSTPDVAQLGNTWVAEFAALRALEPLDRRVAASGTIRRDAYFPGIWDTNVIDGALFGVPWYVDTRLLFYRRDLLADAGYDTVPGTWEAWRAALVAIKARGGPGHYGVVLPLNEWAPPVILGLQAGSGLLADRDTRGAFSEPAFRRAFAFYSGLFADGLAPAVRNNEIANMYQEFERGTFAMWITGPWNLGEIRRRLPAAMQDAWATAPLPGPDGPDSGVSLAGGSSLVLFRSSRRADAAWRFVEFLSRPDRQVRFFALTGDLPARREAWRDSALTADPNLATFGVQLARVVSTPKIPEWELIATRLQERAELAVRGAAPPDTALALLDRDVARILEKRRWLLTRPDRAGDGRP